MKSVFKHLSTDRVLYYSFDKLRFVCHKKISAGFAFDTAIYFDKERPKTSRDVVLIVEYGYDLWFRRVAWSQSWK